jgi:hypothetical protein
MMKEMEDKKGDNCPPVTPTKKKNSDRNVQKWVEVF